jgi:hypothetical protein
MRCDRRKITGDLHRRARERSPSPQPAVQPERPFTPDGRHFDHMAIAAHDEQRNHAALREVNSINGVAWLKKDRALRSRNLFEIRFQKSECLLRQRC